MSDGQDRGEAVMAEALAMLLARRRFGPGVDMGGAHDPTPGEVRSAAQFMGDLRDNGWLEPSAAADLAADRDHWKARAEAAETERDDWKAKAHKAWEQGDKDAVERYVAMTEASAQRRVVEAAKAWRAHMDDKSYVTPEEVAAEAVTERALVAAVDALNRDNLNLYELSAVSDPCPVCGKDDWPAGSAGNARRCHELAEHEGDPRIKPRWRDE